MQTYLAILVLLLFLKAVTFLSCKDIYNPRIISFVWELIWGQFTLMWISGEHEHVSTTSDMRSDALWSYLNLYLD